jgi:hypothetical protein
MIPILTYPIDWAATGAMLQGWSGLLGAAAVIYVARKGTNTWKLQKQAEKQMEIAERIMVSTYHYRDKLNHVRSRLFSRYELQEVEEYLSARDEWIGASKTIRNKNKLAHAYMSRLNGAIAERDKLIDCLPIARALFGHELEGAIKDLTNIWQQLWNDLHAWFENDDEKDGDFAVMMHKSIFSSIDNTQDDEVYIRAVCRLCESAGIPRSAMR